MRYSPHESRTGTLSLGGSGYAGPCSSCPMAVVSMGVLVDRDRSVERCLIVFEDTADRLDHAHADDRLIKRTDRKLDDAATIEQREVLDAGLPRAHAFNAALRSGHLLAHLEIAAGRALLFVVPVFRLLEIVLGSACRGRLHDGFLLNLARGVGLEPTITD